MIYHLDSPNNNFVYPIGTNLPIVFSGWLLPEENEIEYLEFCVNEKLLIRRPLNRDRFDIKETFQIQTEKEQTNGFKHYLNLTKSCVLGANTISISVVFVDGSKFCMNPIFFEAKAQNELVTFEDKFKCLPADHLLKVNGFLDIESYQTIGNEIACGIQRELNKYRPFKNILDYGCGLGRVLYHLKKLFVDSEIFGYDIDHELIKWTNFIFQSECLEFKTSLESYKPGTFDCIYSVSVLTHIYENRDSVLRSINNLLKDDGIFFVTYHDKTLFNELYRKKNKDKESFNEFIIGQDFNDGDEGKGVFYDTTFWIEYMSKYFIHLKTEVRKLCGFQSYSIFLKKELH